MSALEHDGDEATLFDLNENYVRSVAQSDVAWFERHLSDDFLNTSADGTLSDRAGFLAQMAPPSAAPDLRCHDVLVRRFGDFAVIHARTTFTKPDGSAGAGRFTDVWARQNGRWLCIAAHVNRG